MPRPEKVARVAEISESLKAAKNIFITDYSGLNVIDVTEMRKQLRENGVSYRVYKNTLMRRAAAELEMDDLADQFTGQTAVAVSTEDPTVPARILYDFFNRLEKPKVRVFRIEDKQYGPEDFKQLAKLPPRDIVLSQLIAAIESPISALVGTLDGVIRDFVGTVDAIAEKKKES